MKVHPPLPLAAALAALIVAPAIAGEMGLAWDPVQEPDVTGYRIFFDTQPGPNYGNFDDVGSTTQATLGGLPECAWLRVAVKARASDGTLSGDFSNEVQGYAHPRIVSVSPASAERGEVATLTLRGGGFAPGAVPQVTGPGLTVESYSVDSCSQMTVQVTVDEQAALGAHTLEVVNTDGGFGAYTPGFVVGETPVDFTVLSVTPQGGAGDTDPGGAVQVRFSRPLDPSRVTSKRLTLRRKGPPGRSAGKAKASVRLEADGTVVTLTPTAALTAQQAYGVVVKGGKKGIRDVDGNPLAASYDQSPFVTASIVDRITFGPDAGSANDVLETSGQVPADSVLVVTFTEPIFGATVNGRSFKIKRIGGPKVSLAGGTPTLSLDRRSVTITPRDPLPSGANLEIHIKGGKRGVKSERGVTLAETEVIAFTTPVGPVASFGVAR